MRFVAYCDLKSAAAVGFAVGRVLSCVLQILCERLQMHFIAHRDLKSTAAAGFAVVSFLSCVLQIFLV
jgi:tetrahydromethanopterin S-methyltransferase subunit F